MIRLRISKMKKVCDRSFELAFVDLAAFGAGNWNKSRKTVTTPQPILHDTVAIRTVIVKFSAYF